MAQAKADLPILLFTDVVSWREWLGVHHADSSGVWLRFYKKGRGESIHYEEALQDALCYGWIDSQVAAFDEDSYLQKFTPRRPKGMWSKRNIERIAMLEKAGRMMPAGEREVDAAKQDGRWAQAYDSPATMEMPKDFLEVLSHHPEVEAFFRTLNKTNLYAIAWRLQTAKAPATRQRRMDSLLRMLSDGKKIHD